MTRVDEVLALERVERVPGKPHQLAGAVSSGGHRLRVVIEADPRLMGLIETVEAPQLLKLHGMSKGAVARAMGGILAGKEVTLPLDLTDRIQELDPPLVLADLVVDGVPMSIRVWVYAAPGAQTKVFWIGRHEPNPSPAQATAIERALLAHRPTPGSEEDGRP